MTEMELKALQYIINTGGVTIEQFDEDHEPIGPQLRDALMPLYMTIDRPGARKELLITTKAGDRALEQRG